MKKFRNKIKPKDRILIVNDSVGITGVNTYISNIYEQLNKLGFQTYLITPETERNNKKIFLPTKPPIYPDFRLSLNPLIPLIQEFTRIKPHAVLISTAEAPLGQSARIICSHLHRLTPNVGKIPFTLSYTTNLDEIASEYLEKIKREIPLFSTEKRKEKDHHIVQQILQKYTESTYQRAFRVMVSTPTMKEKLKKMGLKNLALSPRGINADLFRERRPQETNPYEKYSWFKEKKDKKIILYWGRIALEKNLESFLDPSCRHYRILIGEGPYRKDLETKYRSENIYFLGPKYGEDLAEHIRWADLAVFPSLTDTFGNTILEANSSGVPVMGFRVQGPQDIILPGTNGQLAEKGHNLLDLIDQTLQIDRHKCREFIIKKYSWEKATWELIRNLKKVHWKN